MIAFGSESRLRISLLVLLAAAVEASPQTAQSGLPTSQVAARQTRKSGNSRSALAAATNPTALPGLCFQPGVGWQRILPEQPGVPATRGTNAPIAGQVSGSTGVASPQAIDNRSSSDRSSSAKQARSAECAGISTHQGLLGAGGERFAILNRSGTSRSAGSPNPGTLTSFQVNAPYHAHSSAGPESVSMTPSAMPSAPTNFASEAGPDEHSDQVGVRAFHAYISSIKLRRLIRNAPDFRTRIQLQQLEKNPTTQLHKARVATKKGATARRPLKGERASESSWRGSVDPDQPRDPRTLVSGADR